jgi:hypothetical protein
MYFRHLRIAPGQQSQTAIDPLKPLTFISTLKVFPKSFDRVTTHLESMND